MNPPQDIPAGQQTSVLQSKTLGKIVTSRLQQDLTFYREDETPILKLSAHFRFFHGKKPPKIQPQLC